MESPETFEEYCQMADEYGSALHVSVERSLPAGLHVSLEIDGIQDDVGSFTVTGNHTIPHVGTSNSELSFAEALTAIMRGDTCYRSVLPDTKISLCEDDDLMSPYLIAVREGVTVIYYPCNLDMFAQDWMIVPRAETDTY